MLRHKPVYRNSRKWMWMCKFHQMHNSNRLRLGPIWGLFPARWSAIRSRVERILLLYAWQVTWLQPSCFDFIHFRSFMFTSTKSECRQPSVQNGTHFLSFALNIRVWSSIKLTQPRLYCLCHCYLLFLLRINAAHIKEYTYRPKVQQYKNMLKTWNSTNRNVHETRGRRNTTIKESNVPY